MGGSEEGARDGRWPENDLTGPSGWRISIKRSALTTLTRLRPEDQDRLRAAIDQLPEGHIVRLQGRDEWRLRVGQWRVVFTIDNRDRLIIVELISSRGDVYKKR